MTVLEAALGYAARGWPVFPCHSLERGRCTCGAGDCRSAGKHPRTANGLLDATREEHVIRLMFGTWPESNLAVATGPAGLVVVDLDVRGDLDGRETLAQLEDEHGRLPKTPEQFTGGGGTQVLFRSNGRPIRSRNGILPGLDVKAQGGYVLVPPSRTRGDYAWNVEAHPDEVPFADLPEWLERILSDEGKSDTRDRNEETAEEPIPEGKRHPTLTSLAGTMRRRGMGQEAILAALLEENARRCRPPLDRREVERIADCVSRYKPDREAARPMARPEIIVREELSAVTSEAEAALLDDPTAGVYQRGSIIVHVARDRAKKVSGFTRPPGAPVIVPASVAWIREQMDRAANWQRWKPIGRGESKEFEKVKASPPKWAAETLEARGEWPFRRLEGVIESPVLRPDGTILDRPGYDDATGLLYEPGEAAFPAVPDCPTREEAARALLALDDPLADFPFVTAADRSVIFAEILTLVGRPAIVGPVPMFAHRAHTPGEGKGLVADVVSTIGTGRPAAGTAPLRDEEETRKLLLTVGLEGTPVVLVDNVSGVLRSDALAGALTRTEFSDRLLGMSKKITVPLRTVWICTGNNLSFAGDLGRRVVVCDLDSKQEHPEDRSGFRYRDLLAHIRAHRPQLVAAALTVLRAYHVAGRPTHGKPRKGSFEAWDDLIRGAVTWASGDDPLDTTERIRQEGDADLDGLRQGLGAWERLFGLESGTVAEALNRARSNREAEAGLCALAESPAVKLDARTLGNALRGAKGRLCDGRRFASVQDKHLKVNLWAVVRE